MTRLEKLTHAVFIVVALVALFVLLDRTYFHPAQQSGPADTRELVGKVFNLPQARWSTDRSNVVLVVSSTCRFCKASVGFYRSIGAAPRHPHIVVVTQDDRENIEEFLRSNAISADEVITTSFDQLGVNLTPTLLMLDHKGLVRKVFVGKLRSESEQDVLSEIQKNEG